MILGLDTFGDVPVDDVLYFRVDDTTRGDFEAEGLASFTYRTKSGDQAVMSYMRAPERCIEDGVIVSGDAAIEELRAAGYRTEPGENRAAA